MNYNADRPIETGEQDLLGRRSFSSLLARSIYEYNGEDSLVIGVFGKWGTGKTSVINMAINELEVLDGENTNKCITMKFAPWNYSDKANLISLFFKALKNAIDIKGNEDLKKKIGDSLSELSVAFDVVSFVPGGGPYAVVLRPLAQLLGKVLKKEKALDESRKAIEAALKESKNRLVIVIDDIDRLTDSQIRDIFQLVKQVADFPNIIYVLAMDRDVVCGALEKDHILNGYEFIEKIIQVSFELPKLRKSKLYGIFSEKLNQIINKIPSEITWDDQYLQDVFRHCVVPYINTIRDVNRVINTFQFRFGMAHPETSFEDMIGITTIEVLEPQLYKWIYNHKEAVCGGAGHDFLVRLRNQEDYDYRAHYQEEFDKLGIDSGRAMECVSALFPSFARDIKHYSYDNGMRSDLKRKMRVADEDRFELYFAFDVDDLKVPRSLVNQCIFELEGDTLIDAIEGINKSGEIGFFLEEVGSFVEEIPYKRLNVLALALLRLQGGFIGKSSMMGLPMRVNEVSELLVKAIVNRLDTENERFLLFYKAVESTSEVGIGSLARIILRIEYAYGRMPEGGEDTEGQIISEEHLEELKKAFQKKILDLSESKSIVDKPDFIKTLRLWELTDRTSAEQYIQIIRSDEKARIHLICVFAQGWSGSNGNGWSFNSNEYSAYFSTEEAVRWILKLDAESLHNFSEIEQIKLSSFVLYSQKLGTTYITEKEAKDMIKEWDVLRESIK